MNALRNKVQLIGNLGKDPEVVTLENGNKRARFTMATNESYKNGAGEKVQDTQWHQVVAFEAALLFVYRRINWLCYLHY